MFGMRPDGKRVKYLNGFYTIIPIVMKKRYDSMNQITIAIELDNLDSFIKEQMEKTGIIYSYMDIIAAALIRTICLRPELNRFVVNSRIYQREGIYYSLAVQKTLKKGAESNETTIKTKYTGEESIQEIHNIIDAKIREAKHVEAETSTDRTARILTSVPTFIMIPLVNFVLWLDKHGILPKAVLDTSPFHTTFFITDMRSIKLPTLHHHVYDFGTTGIFLSTGTDEYQPSYDKEGNLIHKHIMKIAVVMDERFCDGYYFANSFRLFQKILKNPSYLLSRLEPEEVPLTEDEKHAKEKRIKKENKRNERNTKADK
ncbi:MAG: 2-oxoglutarate dehydrogenase [Bacillales bacterium]|nr:2-oxoglutarate dehydrogenase [Bacillales bacterium]